MTVRRYTRRRGYSQLSPMWQLEQHLWLSLILEKVRYAIHH